ncbi:hypothetical protein C8A00DRAFT_19556 [Chaetomidium leptoderma]|uniref:Uncharacterized protein n=1 Tax=Chaetomidium leptoderma TaxID=669021 RepID=A0AAN6VDS7_9PEZI|nr:hypothetical protein C8A00DRAFT_19556 [Chaetomidium leptoderma]
MAAITGRPGTLLGPLTTTWSMPDSCTAHLLTCETCAVAFRGQHCVIRSGSGAVEDNTACWPPTTRQGVTAPQQPFFGWGFYSPGLACPTGYTTACTAHYGGRSEWEVQFSLIPGEAAVGCCPEGFKCANQYGNTCMAVIATNAPAQTTVATAMCSGSQMVSLAPATFPDIITTTASSGEGAGTVETATRRMVLLAPMFQLNYQASDLEAPTSNTASTTSGSAQSSTSPNSSSSGTSSSGTNLPAAAGEGGLSTGATVGIGVGAAVGGIVVGVLALWLFMRKRKRTAPALAGHDPAMAGPDDRTGVPQPQSQHYYAADGQVVTDDAGMAQWKNAHFWTHPQPVELHNEPRAELGETQRAELPTTGIGRPGHHIHGRDSR